MARAAGKAGIPYSLSILGTKSIEEVSANSDGPKLLQIYVFKDRAITADLIERARSAGFDGLIVTVDTPLGGKRERDIVNGMSVPPKLSLSSFYQFACCPSWSPPASWQRERFLFGNLRQNDVAQAIFGGRRRHGRRRSDCRDRSLSAHHRFLLSQRLVIAELHSGAARSWNGRQLMSAPQATMREAPVLLGRPIPVVLPFLKIGLDLF